MRRIWYSRGYQILREGRILHANLALAAALWGFLMLHGSKKPVGCGCAAVGLYAGPTSATECQQLVPSPRQSPPRVGWE
jgi:hypothetical protein